ncbi:MAG: hypothetical protein HY738_09695 [Bacteroidia bacterium]|nr:hypothetical protein [Bacteroidia bacterium]
MNNGDENANKFYLKYCAAENLGLEAFILNWDDIGKWNIIRQQQDGDITMIELIQEGEILENWTEMGTLISTKGVFNISLDESMNMTYEIVKKECPNNKLTFIEKDELGEYPWILFKIECSSYEKTESSESQIYYTVFGKKALYNCVIAFKESTISEETKIKWVNFFRSGKIDYFKE